MLDALLDSIKRYALEHGIILNVLYAILIFALGLIGSKLARRWLTPLLDRSRIADDLLLKSFFLRVLSVSIIILTTLAALSRIGWDVQSFVAGLGITGIILGFAFKDTLSNFAAGLLLLVYRPFRAGHVIEVEGSQGVVNEVTIVNMQMTTNDGVRVIMPNSKVWGAKIINYSLSERRRLELTMKVRDEHIEKAIRVIRSALSEDSRVLQSPEPTVRVAAIADQSATLIVWLWTRPEEYQSAGANTYLRLRTALRQASVQLL